MAARAIDLERIDRFLGTDTDRQIEDALERLRDLWCDLVWAGDDLHGQSDPGLEENFENLELHRKAWQKVGGQTAIDMFDNITDEIWRLVEEGKR